MEIQISIKGNDIVSPADTTVSVNINDIPYDSLHRLSAVLPDVVADAYSRLASQIPTEDVNREFIRNFIYQGGFVSINSQTNETTGLTGKLRRWLNRRKQQ